jgi:hypothetical protein
MLIPVAFVERSADRSAYSRECLLSLGRDFLLFFLGSGQYVKSDN